MATKASNKKPKQEFASKEEVNALAESVGSLVELFKQDRAERAAAPVAAATPVAETAMEKEVRKAAPDVNPVNPAWEEKAEDILGDYLDHCEVFFPKRGGTIFTVVIKLEKSNAALEYLDVMKQDRRSKEIGNEGIEGVEQWCKLVAQNLKRPSLTARGD